MSGISLFRREARRYQASRASDERGQILSITAVAMTMLIICVGLVIDVGHAMLVQRQLQAGVDAAALAGVQHLPDKPMAESVAMQYSATPGSKNAVNTVGNATTTAQALCITGVPGCNRRDNGVNGIKVESRSNVPTWFGRIIGIDKLSVSAKATACSPCTVKPLDIMLVLDRTGSMCNPSGPGGSCPDWNNALSGAQTFLTLMDPSLDKVGLALLPPALDSNYEGNCTYRPWSGTSNPNPWGPGTLNGKYYGYDAWWNASGTPKPVTNEKSSQYVIASLEGADGVAADDYIIQDPLDGSWDLNGASTLVQRLGCARTNGSTHYAFAIEEAKNELNVNGRGSVQDVIIFLSDGAANTMPHGVPSGHWSETWQNKPCGAGVQIANSIKGPQSNPSTIIYTIGYDLDAGAGAPEKCLQPDGFGHQDTSSPLLETGCGTAPSGWGGPSGCTSYDAMLAIASKDAAGLPLFYNEPDPVSLDNIFRAIALDLAGSRGRLIDNNSPSLT